MSREISDGEPLFGTDYEALAINRLAAATSVLDGCTPSKGSGDSVDVASGSAAIASSHVAVAGNNVSLTARISDTRIDAIVIEPSAGNAVSIDGTANAAPSIPDDRALVALVKVPPSGSGQSIDVLDARFPAQAMHADNFTANTTTGKETGLSSSLVSWETQSSAIGSTFTVPVLSSDPGSPTPGDLWINSTDNEFKVHTESNGSVVIPWFDPANCERPILRVTDASGSIKAFEAKDVANSPAYPYLRFDTATLGTLALHDTALGTGAGGRTPGAIDTFEDGDINEYAGATGSFTTQTSTVESGSIALEATDPENTHSITSLDGLDQYPVRGDTFEYHVRTSESTVAAAGMFFGLSDHITNSPDGYFVQVDWGESEIEVFRLDAGSFVQIGSTADFSVPTSEWLRIEIEWSDGGNINVTGYNASGSLLESVSVSDTSYDSGGVGWRSAGSTGDTKTITFDSAEITEVAADSTGVIDDFEDDDIAEYEDNTADFTTQSGTVNSGTFALEGTNPGDGSQSSGSPVAINSYSGLDRYPEAGDTFEYWVRMGQNGDGYPRLHFAKQDSSETFGSRYQVDTNNDTDVFRLYSSAAGGHIASASQSFSTATWYRVVVDWGGGGTITCKLYDSGGTKLNEISGSDSAFTSGGIGFQADSADNSNTFYWDDMEITSTSGTAPAGTVIDDFEDGDIAEYTGETGGFSVVSSPSGFGGSFTLEGTGSFTTISSTSGLNYYPEPGDDFEYIANIEQDNHRSILYFFGDGDASQDTYEVQIKDENTGGESLRLRKHVGGSPTDLATTSISFPSHPSRYRVKVETTGGGDITVTLYNDKNGNLLGQVSATDTDHTNGAIGFFSDGGGTNYYDDIKIN